MVLRVKDFDEAALGEIAKTLHATLPDLKRTMRERFGVAHSSAYTADHAAAARAAIAALADVDSAFASYELPYSLSYCECCNDPDFVGRLLSTPRDDLSENDVANVAASLLYTLGTCNELKYFAPRFCRDALGVPLYDIDSVFSRFSRAGFDEWADVERRAIRNFLGAAWNSALLAGPCVGLAELNDPWLDILDSMASLGFIVDALEIWSAQLGHAADSRILELLERLDVGAGAIKVAGAGGLSDNGAAYALLGAWLLSGAVRHRIEAAAAPLRGSDAARAERIDSVLRSLESQTEP